MIAREDMEDTIRKWDDTSGIRTGGGGIGSAEGDQRFSLSQVRA